MTRVGWTAIALLCGLVALGSPATANTWGPEATDMWWDSTESGWGVNVNHQSDKLFLTFYVYGRDGRAVWYSATATYRGTTAEGGRIFTGDLYETTGPWLGAPSFDPRTVTYRRVGEATFTHRAFETARLDYAVDGVAVSKLLERLTFGVNNLGGSYLGGLVADDSACTTGASRHIEQALTLDLAHGASHDIAITTQSAAGTCTYAGRYRQHGRVARIDGTFACSNGENGVFSALDVDANVSGWTARFFADVNRDGGVCHRVGQIGGIRR